MKRFVLASLATLAVVAAMGSANAADMPRRHAMPAKAPAYAVPYNWTGAYVGINGGGGWGSSIWSIPAGPPVVRSRRRPRRRHARLQLADGPDCVRRRRRHRLEQHPRHAGSAPAPRARPATIGSPPRADASAMRSAASCLSSPAAPPSATSRQPRRPRHHDHTKAGWTLGGGLESAIAGPWTAKVEYLYVDLGKRSRGRWCCTDASFTANIVRGGINYRF